jgi:hypothetical protein
MYEDINFGDPLSDGDSPATMSKANLAGDYMLGSRSTKIATPVNPDGTGGESPFAHDESAWSHGEDQEAAINGETRATFGAKRLGTGGNDPYASLNNLDAEFTVRAYFTRSTNPLVTSSSNAPRRAPESVVGDDYKYYIAEGSVSFSQQAGQGVVTGVSGVAADRNREVKSVTYVNSLGMQSSQPFSGVNVVVTRYTDGTTTTTKIVK